MKKLFAGLTFVLASVTAQAALVEIAPLNQTRTVGDDVIVNILGSGFATPTVGGGFSLSFDPSILSLAAADVGLAAPPWDGSFPRTDTIGAGVLADFSFNQFSGLSGNFPIAQLKFKAIGVGLSNLALGPSNSFPFADASGGLLEVGFGNAQVKVIPEPATWGLLTAGLVMVGFLSARRQRALQV